jgi:hypothetical protein
MPKGRSIREELRGLGLLLPLLREDGGMVTGMGACRPDRCILVRMRGTVPVAIVIPFPLKAIIPQGTRTRNQNTDF